MMSDETTDSEPGENRTEYPLPVSEQDALDEVIKVRWQSSQASRAAMVHSLNASREDANADEPLLGAGTRALNREKTNVVVRTVQEAESLLYELDQYIQPHGIPTPRGSGTRPFERVRDELETQLDRHGYTVDRDSRRPNVTRGDA